MFIVQHPAIVLTQPRSKAFVAKSQNARACLSFFLSVFWRIMVSGC